MPLLRNDLIPSVHIGKVPQPGTSVIDLNQMFRLYETDVSDECYGYYRPPIPGSFLLLWT